MINYIVILLALIINVILAEPPSGYPYPTPNFAAPGNFEPAEQPKDSYGAPAPEYGPPKAESVIHKHVYVHVAPPEPDYEAPRKPIEQPPAQKHYKIVFIKAPSPPMIKPPVIPPPQQNEEKTLVYVLVKKPEEQPDIVIPTPIPTLPSKPEVYFIRYRTQNEGSKGGYPNSIAPSEKYGPPNLTYDSVPASTRHHHQKYSQ